MNINLSIAILALFCYAYFIIITRKSNTFEGYSVGNRSVGFLLIFASMCANYIGPGMTLGLTANGYESGYFFLFVASFYGIGKIFEAQIFAPRIRNKFIKAFTLGDIIGGKNSHNNRTVQFVAGLISLGLVIGLCTIMAAKAGDILNQFLGVPNIIGTSIVTIVVMSYSVFGGIRSSMQTDFVQFCMFMTLIPLLIFIAIYSREIKLDDFIPVARESTISGFNSKSALDIFGLIVTWFFGEMLIPPTISTILSSNNAKTSKRALTYSGLMMIFWLVMMLSLGVISKIILPNMAINDKILLQLGSDIYPVGVFGLFTVAMIGVVMSSQDALINGASVIFSRDILHTLNKQTEQGSLKTSRIAGICVGILSIVFAVFIPSVIKALLFFYSIWVPAMLVSTLFAVYLKKMYWQSSLLSMIIGTISSIAWELFNPQSQIPTIIFGLFASISIYLITHSLYYQIEKK